jgi:hypothetical protein
MGLMLPVFPVFPFAGLELSRVAVNQNAAGEGGNEKSRYDQEDE